MITVHPQYVVDAAETRTAVLIPVAEWEQILEALEELDDIRAYDAAKAGGALCAGSPRDRAGEPAMTYVSCLLSP